VLLLRLSTEVQPTSLAGLKLRRNGFFTAKCCEQALAVLISWKIQYFCNWNFEQAN
jgi:hypothetical protein